MESWSLLRLLFPGFIIQNMLKGSILLRRNRILSSITLAIVCVLVYRITIWVLQLWGGHILTHVFFMQFFFPLLPMIFVLYFHLSLQRYVWVHKSCWFVLFVFNLPAFLLILFYDTFNNLINRVKLLLDS